MARATCNSLAEEPEEVGNLAMNLEYMIVRADLARAWLVEFSLLPRGCSICQGSFSGVRSSSSRVECSE